MTKCPDISGIYAIHGVEKHVYIGESIGVWGRWAEHRSALDQDVHSSRLLQAHWNRLPENHFRHQILERLDPRKSLLLSRERLWMLRYHAAGYTLYNERVPFTVRNNLSAEISARYFHVLSCEPAYQNLYGRKIRVPYGIHRGKIAKVKKVFDDCAIVRLCTEPWSPIAMTVKEALAGLM